MKLLQDFKKWIWWFLCAAVYCYLLLLFTCNSNVKFLEKRNILAFYFWNGKHSSQLNLNNGCFFLTTSCVNWQYSYLCSVLSSSLICNNVLVCAFSPPVKVKSEIQRVGFSQAGKRRIFLLNMHWIFKRACAVLLAQW